MDLHEFPTSPAKRQRTASPDPAPVPDNAIQSPSNPRIESTNEASTAVEHDVARTQLASVIETVQQPSVEEQPQPPPPATDDASNSLLDALMLQVEAESAGAGQTMGTEAVPAEEPAQLEEPMSMSAVPPLEIHHDATPRDDAALATIQLIGSDAANAESTQMEVAEPVAIVQDEEHTAIEEVAADSSTPIPTVANASDTPAMMEPVRTEGAEAVPQVATTSVEPVSEQTMAMDGVVTNGRVEETIGSTTISGPVPVEAVTEGAEWEVDSSPYDSSSDSDSSSDTSSSDDDSDEDDGDYAMLDPEEAARILMRGDGGSDDEGDGSKRKEGAQIRTANERFEEVIPKPDIVVTEEVKIEELGNVEAIVEKTVVIKAKISGEYQVLEPGSLICLKDRSVVGVVADLIGRVEEPRYTIRFTNDDDIKASGLWNEGTTVFYVPQHSTFVFTQPLKSVKGSDASNFHDEEVGADEMEFSDDEAEAEHKRQLKAKRQGRTLDNPGRGGRGAKFARGSNRGGDRGRGAPRASFSSNNVEGSAYGNGSLEINYDDVPMQDTNDDGYTPLQRPADLADMLSHGEAPQEQPISHPLPLPPPSQFNRDDLGGRGRGSGQQRGGRGGFRHNRGGRGGFNQNRTNHFNQNGQGNTYQNGMNRHPAPGNQTNFQQHNNYAQQSNSNAPPVPAISVPTTPSITPHNITYPPMTPSPITPLPNGSFNFSNRPYQAPGTYPAFSAPPGIPGLPPPPPFPQQSHYQQSYQPPPPPGNYSYQAQPQQRQQPASQNNYLGGAWANNPAMAAFLQRQMDEQRRSQGR